MVNLKSKREIVKIHESCKIVAEQLALLKEKVRPGVQLSVLDKMVQKNIEAHNAKPAFKGYHGFPASICASLNEEVVHGIPDDRILQEGDIISIDIGVLKNGYYGDAAFTYPVGEVEESIKRFLQISEESLYKGLEQMRIGNRLYDISHAVQKHAEKHGYSVVRDYVGHGIGRNLHEAPQVPNFGKPNTGMLLKNGLVIAVEPMINLGTHKVKTLGDEWTVVTQDGKLSAHFEHTAALTENGCEILTRL